MLPRIRADGYIYYITSVLHTRLPIFTKPSFIIPLLDSFNYYRFQYDFKLLGYVIMPDHFHILIHPQGQAETVSDAMRDFKRFTSGRITRQAKMERKLDWVAAFEIAGDETSRAEYKVWQDSFWETAIWSEKFLREKLNYIHLNPVRAGLVENPQDYPYSSFRNYELNDETLIEIDKDWQ
ncbi:MAG: transposase [Chloroflexota bacterium]|nr:MAG: transposase [Chloroflexota bacterium]